jgi:hypothetical protein
MEVLMEDILKILDDFAAAIDEVVKVLDNVS